MSDGLDIVVVTGLSGSGKSVAIRALEDRGFFCIDNLPVALIPQVIELCLGYAEGIQRIALGVDLRAGQFLQSCPEALAWLRTVAQQRGAPFSPSSNHTLLPGLRRTRRPHPPAAACPRPDGI